MRQQIPLNLSAVDVTQQQLELTYDQSDLRLRFSFDEIMQSDLWLSVLRLETKNNFWRSSHGNKTKFQCGSGRLC